MHNKPIKSKTHLLLAVTVLVCIRFFFWFFLDYFSYANFSYDANSSSSMMSQNVSLFFWAACITGGFLLILLGKFSMRHFRIVNSVASLVFVTGALLTLLALFFGSLPSGWAFISFGSFMSGCGVIWLVFLTCSALAHRSTLQDVVLIYLFHVAIFYAMSFIYSKYLPPLIQMGTIALIAVVLPLSVRMLFVSLNPKHNLMRSPGAASKAKRPAPAHAGINALTQRLRFALTDSVQIPIIVLLTFYMAGFRSLGIKIWITSDIISLSDSQWLIQYFAIVIAIFLVRLLLLLPPKIKTPLEQHIPVLTLMLCLYAAALLDLDSLPYMIVKAIGTVLFQTLFFWQFILCMRKSTRFGYSIFGIICALISAVVAFCWFILANTEETKYLLAFGISFLYMLLLVFDNSKKPKVVKLELSQNGTSGSMSLQQGTTSAVGRFGLTKREGEILFLLAQGRPISYIEKTLSLSNGTVRTHTQRIYSKMNVHSKQQLIDLVEQIGAG